ncbi:glutathione synthetase [Galbibacter marinus]|uniref:Glutathione synthetase n=1 Tax=Galbibacter marinus TaxID=555500 RepID=K2Q6F2_9FLAO|nr:glutathione synthetase [Galbibacter marinus]EKF56436.1 glutathione synthetase [Galbibacter marinus]
MKICFVLNKISTEKAGTSVALMTKAHNMGHEVYAMGVGDFKFQHQGTIFLYAKSVDPSTKVETPKKYLKVLQSGSAKETAIESTDLDVLFIRNNPTEEGASRHWAEQSGLAFGRMIQQQGVLVLNDANALSYGFIDKLYFEELPQEIKPASIITRKKDDILKFWEKNNKQIVLKPLEGSGGKNVFLIDKHEKNINQIIQTISKDGYVIAQEYLPAVKKGDVRVLLMNGRILTENGEKAIIRRVCDEGEFRSNFKQGATADKSDLTKSMQKIIDLTAPKLIKDGLFFVGLDVIEDKLIEINILSPGGLDRFADIGLTDFTTSVIEAIERKLYYKLKYMGQIENKILATMH